MEKYTEYVEVDGFKVNCIKNDITITKYLKVDNKLCKNYFLC